jgi:hypothetical protein
VYDKRQRNNNNNNNNNNLKEELIRIWQAAYIIPLVLSTRGIFPNKLHESLKLLNIRSDLYIQMQKAAILNTCRVVSFWQNSE